MNIIRLITPTLLCLLAMNATVRGQVIYQETFPATGAAPLSSVGWANDIVNNPNRIYVFQGDRVFAFGNTAVAEAFYTSTALDTGATGQAFTAIDPTAYQFGVTLQVDIAAGFSPDEVRSRFLVQMDSGNWYAAATALNVPLASTNDVFSNYSVPFNPAAANWLDVTVSGTGSVAPSPVTVGGAATSNLTGSITGVGLLVSYGPPLGTPLMGGGTHNFDNITISATSRPGDVNLDTFVTLDDLTIIRQNFRQAVTSRIQGDVTNDGFVNFDDFRQWKDNYVPAVGEANVGIPEPSAILLATPALWGIGQMRRRRVAC
jgi:hypothetical protein